MESVVNDNFNELNLRCVSSGIIAFPFIRMTHKYFSKYTCDIPVIYICTFFQLFVLSFVSLYSRLPYVYLHDGYKPGKIAKINRNPNFSALSVHVFHSLSLTGRCPPPRAHKCDCCRVSCSICPLFEMGIKMAINQKKKNILT